MRWVSLIWGWLSSALVDFKDLPAQHVKAEIQLPEITTYINIGSGSMAESPSPSEVKIAPTTIPLHFEVPMLPVTEVSHHVSKTLITMVLLLAVLYLGIRIVVELYLLRYGLPASYVIRMAV